MTSNNSTLKSALAAQIRDRLTKSNRSSGVKAMNYHKLNVGIMAEKQILSEYPYKLIDYTNCNEALKRKNMTILKATELNRLLKGSGLSWARGGYEGGY